MTDIRIGIDALVPQAVYFGGVEFNTEEEFNALRWEDERTKPSWAEIKAASDKFYADLQKEEATKLAKKAELLSKLGITEEEAKILLS